MSLLPHFLLFNFREMFFICRSKSLFLLFIIFTGTANAWAGSPQNLFLDTSLSAEISADAFSTGVEVRRSRFVTLNSSLLMPANGLEYSEDIHLNLFNDTSLACVLDAYYKNPSGSLTIQGHVPGDAFSKVTMILKDSAVAGQIETQNGVYRIRYIQDGWHWIEQIKADGFPPAGEPIRITNVTSSDTSPTTAQDDGTQIDVLVAYTATARAAAGGTTAIENEIDLAESLANTTFSNSGVVPRIRIVSKVEVTYSETGFSFSTALNDAANGNITNLHTFRDQFGADQVTLLVEGDNSLCGLAFLQTSVSSSFASNAYSVVQRNCITNQTFTHELAHNMGARHDRAEDNVDGSPFTYNHGYADATNNFRTVMATQTECATCPRVQYMSNPDVTVNGAPAGIAEGQSLAADNRKTLNQTASTVANFRTSVVIDNFINNYDATSSVVSPYWQAGTNSYTFMAVSHPSLEMMSSQIGVVVYAIKNNGDSFGAAVDFTVSAGQTQRVFITSAAQTFTLNSSDSSFLTGNGSGGGQLVIHPKATSPKEILGSANANGRGYPDVTLLSYWGAIVLVQSSNNNGFAMEFIGDLHDSTSGIN